jgi:hypothetical protein
VKHRLFTLLSTLSLLLFLTTAALWLRSYWSQEKLTWVTQNGYRSIWTAHGSLELGFFQSQNSYKPTETYAPRYSRDRADPPINGLIFLEFDPPVTFNDWQHAGFALHQVHNGSRLHVIAFAPFWSLALLTLLLPLAWAITRLRNHHREQSGLCPTCGYDLRATPTRCPECGTIPQGTGYSVTNQQLTTSN